MAQYVQHLTLVGSTAQSSTLTFTTPDRFELTHHGDQTDLVFVNANGTATVDGDECDVLLASERIEVQAAEGVAVSLISAGTPKVAVRAMP